MEKKNLDQLCAQPWSLGNLSTKPHSAPIYLASVYQCESPEQARNLLTGEEHGYVYQRDGNPNSDLLAKRCQQLHDAAWAVITSSGMSAISSALLAFCQPGDHLVVSQDLYGRSLDLLVQEASRLQIDSTLVDAADTDLVKAAIKTNTKMVVVETISNPTLKLCDIAAIAELAHTAGAMLLVDNTFASPIVCQPLNIGADLVVESLTKIMNGHSDGILGMLAGTNDHLTRVKQVLSIWGTAASAFDSWLAARGISTLHLRAERASANALRLAEFLSQNQNVSQVIYPGLPKHPQHELGKILFGDQFGSIVTFTLKATPGNEETVATKFIQAAEEIPFCPSLGEFSTTLSHPCSTSHRNLSSEQLQNLGISAATIRLSVGTEDISTLKQIFVKIFANI